MKTHLVCISFKFQNIHFTLTDTDTGYRYLHNLKRHCKIDFFFLVSRDLHERIYITDIDSLSPVQQNPIALQNN